MEMFGSKRGADKAVFYCIANHLGVSKESEITIHVSL